MKPLYILSSEKQLQDQVYSTLNDFSESHKFLGRMCALPVAIVDVGIATLASPALVIHSLGLAAINLLGVAFSENCSLKDALYSAKQACATIMIFPVKLAFAPIEIIFQLVAILINPEKVQSVNYRNNTFFKA